MNILGWTIARTDYVSPERQRADRNRAAMTAGVGLATLAGGVVAGRLHRDEISFAEQIVREAHASRWLRDTYHRQSRADYEPGTFAATLRRRLGAAEAVEADPQFVPILAEEIELLDHAMHDLLAGWLHQYIELGELARSLVEDLHLRLGHAEAVQYLGTIAVFDDRMRSMSASLISTVAVEAVPAGGAQG